MRVSVRVTGGYAGMDVTHGPIETADLPVGAAREIEDQVDRLELLAPPASGDRPVGSDLIEFDVTVWRDGVERVMHLVDDQSERALTVWRLIEQLQGSH